MRSFWEHGVDVASASDYPVSPPPDPLLAIQRGVLRRDPRFPETSSELWPEEAVTVERMIESFTINGAYANFLEDETGSLEPGKSADLVVLSENILELPAERIHEAAVSSPSSAARRCSPPAPSRASSRPDGPRGRGRPARRRPAPSAAARGLALDEREGEELARLGGGLAAHQLDQHPCRLAAVLLGVVVERRHRRRAGGAEAEVAGRRDHDLAGHVDAELGGAAQDGDRRQLVEAVTASGRVPGASSREAASRSAASSSADTISSRGRRPCSSHQAW